MKSAFIGLGTMGIGMANNILKAGHELTVHNRTRDKEEALEKGGARRAATPREAAVGAEVIIICVSDTPDVREMILGENGIINGAAAGSVVVDMSTISPSATREMAAALAEKGVRMIDAPVSGGSEGAANRTLALRFGGEAADVFFFFFFFFFFWKTITHVGPIGAGQVTKAINQIVIAGTYLGVAEGMALGLKAGLDMDKVVQAIAGGAAGSWVLDNRAGNMINNTYPLGFRVRLHYRTCGSLWMRPGSWG